MNEWTSISSFPTYTPDDVVNLHSAGLLSMEEARAALRRLGLPFEAPQGDAASEEATSA